MASTPASAASAPAPSLDFDIVRVYPHDRAAFTQGLVYRDGYLYESSGLQGQSTLRQVELETGRVVREVKVPPQHFAEGLADFGGRLFQLTWQSQLGLIYDIATLTQTGTFSYTGEGWGLARDGSRLVMSDGTSTLRFLDPTSLQETGRITVTDGGRPLADLNELESVKGEIFANVWMTDHIVIISPKTGRVTGRINLRGLLTADDLTRQVDVLNGIAYDAAGDRLFVTGKWWPKLFEIRLRRN
jgi:glutamine cyclotransferase